MAGLFFTPFRFSKFLVLDLYTIQCRLLIKKFIIAFKSVVSELFDILVGKATLSDIGVTLK